MLPGFGQPVDFAAIRAGVDESGFQLLSLEVELSGVLTERRDTSGALQPMIEIGGSGQLFWILEGESPAEREVYAELQRRLEQSTRHTSLLGKAGPQSEPHLSVVLQRVAREAEARTQF